jgi:hypothetical protein
VTLFSSGVKNAQLSKPYAKLKERRFNPNEGGRRFWESPRKDHGIGSSGLNLTCEGLLLGMRAEGHEYF